MNSYWIFTDSHYWHYSELSFMTDLRNGHYYGNRQTGIGLIISKLAVL